jgi:hypothetical protein
MNVAYICVSHETVEFGLQEKKFDYKLERVKALVWMETLIDNEVDFEVEYSYR